MRVVGEIARIPVPVYLVVGTPSEDASALAPLIEFESKSDECRGGGGGGNGGGGGGGGGGCEISHGTQWMLVSFFLSLVRIPPLGLEVSHGGYHGGLL